MSILWQILISVVCLALALGLIVTRFKFKMSFPQREPVPEHEDHGHHEPHHHSDHGHDDHGHGHGSDTPLWKTLLGWCTAIAAIGLLAVFFVTYVRPKLGLDQMPGASREYRRQLAINNGTLRTPQGPSIPDDARYCGQYEGGKTTIEPGKSIRVIIPVDMLINFTPNTEDGTITACDYHKPDKCSSTTSVLKVGTRVLAIKNITVRPVEFSCNYTRQ